MSWSDFESHQRKQQRVAARCATDGVARIAYGADLGFQLFDIRPVQETAGIADLGNRLQDLVSHRQIAAIDVQQRYRGRKRTFC